MATNMASLPKMHCLPAERRMGRVDRGAVKALATQQRINMALTVIHDACRLCVSCSDDPTTDEANFTRDEGATSSLRTSIETLYGLCQQIAIPVVMTNAGMVENEAVFGHLYGTLVMLHGLCAHLTRPLFSHLVHAGFLPASLNIKHKHRGSSESVCTFLCIMTVYLLDPGAEELEQWQGALQTGIPLLPGDMNDGVNLLKQRCSEPADPELQAVQWSLLALLYLDTLLGNRNLDEGVLYEGLTTYLNLHEDAIDKLLPTLLRAIVFLLASCPNGQITDNNKQGLSSLFERLQELDLEAWCVPHPTLLHWAFSHPAITHTVGYNIVSLWLRQEVRENMVTSQIETLAPTTPACLQVLMEIVTNGPEEIAAFAAGTLKKITHHTKGEERTCMLAELGEEASDTLHSLLLKDHVATTKGHNIASLLALTSFTKQELPDMPLLEVDFKLTYHLSNLMTRNRDSCSVKEENVLNALNCLLIQAHNKHDNKIATVLLSNASFLEFVERSASRAAWITLSLLILHQHQHHIQVSHSVQVPQETMLCSLQSADLVSHMSGMCLWSAYLTTSTDTSLLILTKKGKRAPALLDETLARSIMVCLQQTLLKNNALLYSLSVECFSLLLSATQAQPQLETHLLHSPWNRLMMEVLWNQYLPNLPDWLINLTQLFASGGVDILGPAHKDGLLQNMNNQQNIRPLILKLSQQGHIHANKELLSTLTNKTDNTGKKIPYSKIIRPLSLGGIIVWSSVEEKSND